MTFDEAIEELKTLSKNGADTWYGDNLEKRTHVRGHIESGSVEMLIYKLREEYAPTIEMTKMQMKQMMSFKEVNAGFSTFMYKQGLGQVPAFSDFITTQRENELLQAWLHPETIKIIGEK